MTSIGLIESDDLRAGNPARLLNPIDTFGRLCGYDSSVKNRPKGYFMMTGAIVCVESCPSTTDFDQFVCVDNSAPEVYRTSNVANGWSGVKNFECLYEVDSYSVMNYCIWDTDGFNSSELAHKAKPYLTSSEIDILTSYNYDEDSGNSWFVMFSGDLWNSADVIFGFGIGVAVALAFVYITLLRVPGILDLIIWGIITAIFLCLAVGTIMLYTLSEQYRNDEELGKTTAEADACYYFSWILGIVTVLYVCLILFLRSRIKLAIAVVKEAGHAMTDMPMVLLLPIIQTVGMVLFLVPWVIYLLFLASSGEMTTSTESYDNGSGTPVSVTTREMEYNDATNYAFVYMVFCFFWTSQFIVAMGQIIIAMTIACWYFTKDRSTLGNETFFWALKASWVHAGSAAFGSLVIAIVKFIRWCLTRIEKNLSKSKNSAAQFVLRCMQCCMWCVEKCLKFLNKNAYIQIAIYGYGFCRAARSAFFLLLRNLARVFAVSKVSDFVLFLGKILIPVATTMLAYLVLAYGKDGSEMNGIIAPLVLTYLLAYFVSCMFNEIYGMCIQTILLCYVADEEMFENPAERFIPGTLKNTLTHTQKAAAEAAAKNVAPEEMLNVEPEDKPVSPELKTKPSPQVTPAKTTDLM